MNNPAADPSDARPDPAAPPPEFAEPVVLPITGELDLHTFQPRDLGALIPAYLEACTHQGLRHVRIIHGKGAGTLRTTVHVLLQRSPLVHSYRLGDETTGGWGATLVRLKSAGRRPNPVD